MKKKILITGGMGFIGSHLAERLSEEYDVYIFDKIISNFNYGDSITFIQGDLTNKDDLKKLPENLFGIVHLAAISRVKEAIKDFVNTMEIGVMGTMNLLDFIKDKETWIILGSTNEISHHNIYGLAKHVSELCVERYSEDYRIKSLILKFASVYGSKRDIQDKLIPTLTNQALNNQDLIIENGARMGDFIHIDNILQGIYLGIKHISNVEGNYFDKIPLCSGTLTRADHLAREIIKETNSNSNLIIKTITEQTFEPMNTEKAERILGFKAEKRSWVNDELKDKSLNKV